MKKIAYLVTAIASVFALTFAANAQDTDDAMDDMMDDGLVTVTSELSFEDTVMSAQQILEAEGFGIPLVLSHTDNAASVDLELPNTTLIVFGNPMVGTSLMQESRSMAIDLPQRFLIREDEDGVTYITYNDPAFLANRHGVTEQDEKIGNIANRLAALAEMVATTAPEM